MSLTSESAGHVVADLRPYGQSPDAPARKSSRFRYWASRCALVLLVPANMYATMKMFVSYVPWADEYGIRRRDFLEHGVAYAALLAAFLIVPRPRKWWVVVPVIGTALMLFHVWGYLDFLDWYAEHG